MKLAIHMYLDRPYAREVGHVVEAAGLTEGHDVPQDVLNSILHWLRKGGHDPVETLDMCRKGSLDGGRFCQNEGCEVVGHLKEFKVCPQCKIARYCGAACQTQDWTAGGHKETCGTMASTVARNRATAQQSSCF